MEKAQEQNKMSALIFKCKAVAAAVSSCELEELLDEVVDALTQQEATIRALRAELVELTAKAMSEEDVIRHLRAELCNASAVAMEHAEAVKTFRAEIDLLNKRPKR
jgi:ABC-type transporter Mla subunit MlaD